MSRLLLALFLLSTLSACQPPADDTDHELPPERRDETGAQAGWTLPWYYLAAPVCLVGGTVAADPVPTVLIDSLLALSYRDSTEFQNVLLGTAPDTSLIDRIQGIVNAGNPKFPWNDTWADLTDDDLAIRVLHPSTSAGGVLQHETMLRNDTLVLPWPFPNDLRTDSRLVQRVNELGFAASIPQAPVIAGTPYSYIDRLLRVADTLVVPLFQPPPDPLDSIKDDPAAVRSTILQRVRGHSDYRSESAVTFPTSLRISVNTTMPATATRVRYDPLTHPGVHLELGWNTDRAIKVDFHKWPCDALLQQN